MILGSLGKVPSSPSILIGGILVSAPLLLISIGWIAALVIEAQIRQGVRPETDRLVAARGRRVVNALAVAIAVACVVALLVV